MDFCIVKSGGLARVRASSLVDLFDIAVEHVDQLLSLQVAYKHMGDCRHVILASSDRSLVATGANQSSILACEGLAQANDSNCYFV